MPFSILEGLKCSVNANLWCCSSLDSRSKKVTCQAASLFSGCHPFLRERGSFSPVFDRVRVCSGISGMNDESKHEENLRNLSSFISKSSERIRARFWSPRSISDVALCSAVTTAFMVCQSFVFEGLECSLDSNLWCYSSPGERYLYTFSTVLHEVRVCSGLARTNDESKQQVRRKFRSCFSSEVCGMEPRFGFQD